MYNDPYSPRATVDIPALRAVRGGLHHVGLRAGLVGHGPVPVRARAGGPGAARARAAAPQLHTRLHQELRPRLLPTVSS